MRVLHVNDVASVATLLCRASGGQDELYQPRLRRSLPPGAAGSLMLAAARARDAWNVRRAFRRGGFTNLHVHYATFALIADVAGLDYSLHLHGGDILRDAAGRKGAIVKRAVARARRVVVSTPDLLTHARRLRGDAIYCPNPMELPPERTRRRGGRAPRVILLSKLDPRKGLEQQLVVLRDLRNAVPELRFSFLSHGALPIAERERYGRELALLGGTPLPQLPREEFLELLWEHDLALGQLEVGALGMSELEALATGLPVIADARAHDAIGMTPPVIPPARAVSEVLRMWRDDGAAWSAIGARGRAYVARHHDPETVLRSLRQAIAGGAPA